MESNAVVPLIETEFRNLLNGALGTTQVISSLLRKAIQNQQTLSPVELKQHMRHLDDINADFKRLLDTLSDYRLMEKGELKAEICAIDFPDLLEKITHPFKLRAKEKGLVFEIDYEEETSPIVYGDLLRVTQIMNHLLDNSLKFTTSGRIDVVVTSSWQGSAKNQTLEVSVIDTGMGIEADKLQQVFNQFLKLHTGDRGLGLGLTLVKHFVEILGGRIGINSVVDKGTRVTFTLPVTNERDEKNAIQELSKLRLWGVESEESLAPALEKQLQFSRLTSQIVPMSEAIFKCQQAPATELPNIMLVVGQKLTQNMAYFARAFRASPSLKKTFLVLVLSPEQYEFDREQAYAHGYHAVISASKYILFAESLIDAWKYWTRKGEQAMALSQRKGDKNKVLVIEDHVINQKVLKMLLAEIGLDADIAPNGKAGLEAIDKNAYRAVFVDMGLPDITGLEVITQLRAREDEKRSLPAIVITAGGHRESVETIKESEIDAYLLKPVTVTQLRDVLTPYFQLKELA